MRTCDECGQPAAWDVEYAIGPREIPGVVGIHHQQMCHAHLPALLANIAPRVFGSIALTPIREEVAHA